MNKTLKTTAIAIAVAGATAVSASSAFAVDVIFDPGTVAYGYSDGYWSRDHVWHTWAKPEYVQTYRAYPHAAYHDWVHTRDADQGWVEIHH